MLSNRELPAILSACDEAKNERKSRNVIICLDGTGDQYVTCQTLFTGAETFQI